MHACQAFRDHFEGYLCTFKLSALTNIALHHLMQRGYTPLLKAAVEGHEGVASFLLKNGSDIYEENNVSTMKYIYNFDHEGKLC